MVSGQLYIHTEKNEPWPLIPIIYRKNNVSDIGYKCAGKNIGYIYDLGVGKVFLHRAQKH